MSMGFIEYNGIKMEIKKTLLIARDHVNSSDGTTYLYTRWTLDVHAVVNPGALSYASGPIPVATSGFAPTDTDHSIRRALRVHRKKLVYSVGTTVLVESPVSPATVDSNNGPIVQKADILNFSGLRTFYVHFRVVTFVNDCKIQRQGGGGPNQGFNPVGPSAAGGGGFNFVIGAPGTVSGNPLLAHRWSKVEDVDQDHYLTVTTSGTAVFDTAALQRIGLGVLPADKLLRAWPDQYRKSLIQKLPIGWKRMSLQVNTEADGSTLHYRIVDREQPMTLRSNWNMTRAECYTTGWFSKNSLQQIFTKGVGSAVRGIGEGSNPLSKIGRAVGGLLAGIASAAVPIYRFNVVARVWGNFLSDKSRPIITAVGLVLNRLGGIPAAVFESSEFMVQCDDLGRWAECTMTIESGLEDIINQLGTLIVEGPGATIRNGIRSVMDRLINRPDELNFGYVRATNTFTDGTGDVPPLGDVRFSAMKARSLPPVVGMRDINLPNSNGTRGTWWSEASPDKFSHLGTPDALSVFMTHALLSDEACPDPCARPGTNLQLGTYERNLCSAPDGASGLGARRTDDTKVPIPPEVVPPVILRLRRMIPI